MAEGDLPVAPTHPFDHSPAMPAVLAPQYVACGMAR
jgi:hypothetical protein